MTAAVGGLGAHRPEAGRAVQRDRLDRRGAHDIEADAVALLDGGDGGVLAAPGERPDDREAHGDAGDLGGEEGEAAGDQREEQQRPQAVEQDRAGMVLGQGGAGARAGEQARDRRVGLGAAAEAQPDQGGDHPPAERDGEQALLGADAHLRAGDGEHGDGGERGRGARAEQDGGLEEIDEAHVLRPPSR